MGTKDVEAGLRKAYIDLPKELSAGLRDAVGRSAAAFEIVLAGEGPPDREDIQALVDHLTRALVYSDMLVELTSSLARIAAERTSGVEVKERVRPIYRELVAKHADMLIEIAKYGLMATKETK